MASSKRDNQALHTQKADSLPVSTGSVGFRILALVEKMALVEKNRKWLTKYLAKRLKRLKLPPLRMQLNQPKFLPIEPYTASNPSRGWNSPTRYRTKPEP